LDSQIAKLKNIEKDVRNIESANARLEKTLYQAEKDNSKLVAELKEKNDDIKRTETKLKGVNNSTAELGITYKNLDQQVAKTKNDLDRNTAILEN
jgi:septal ring factor EnvC (AmiA/AmiB activator)